MPHWAPALHRDTRPGPVSGGRRLPGQLHEALDRLALDEAQECPLESTRKTEVRVYDYVDQRVPVLTRMHKRRLAGYRAIAYERADEATL